LIYDGDNISEKSKDEVFTELEACRTAILMIKNFEEKVKSNAFPSTCNYSDVAFFLRVFLGDDKRLVQECLKFNIYKIGG